MTRSGHILHPLLKIYIYTHNVDGEARAIARDVSENVDRVFERGNFSMEALDRALVLYSKWMHLLE